MGNTDSLPLGDLCVLELGHIVAGPTAGQILADLGADVIKIESVDGGDRARSMPGGSAAMFHFLNRNKRSIALDLKGNGKEIFLKMAASADIVIDNFSHGVTDRLGIGYRDASAINPGLIWLSIKGYLPGGPNEAQPLLDELAQMAGGLAFMTGPVGSPMRAGASVIDIGSATYGVIAVLSALRQRTGNGGKGQMITAGLFETSVYWVAQWMAAAQMADEDSVPMPQMAQGTRMGFGVYSLFSTADQGLVFIGIVSQAQWERFCPAFDEPRLASDPRFLDPQDRVSRRPELAGIIGEIMVRHDLAEITRRLTECSVPFAPVRRPDQLSYDDHLMQSGQLMDVPLPGGKDAKLPKLPFRASGFDMSLRRPAPALGGDTDEILLALGYSTAEIEAMRVRGAIGG